jgi:uncharacterized protein (TIGR01319 family)
VDLVLTVDFGSTFTKAAVLDLGKEELVASVATPSTVDTDITVGLHEAMEQLRAICGVNPLDIKQKLACSSAAGGLCMVAIGLVKEFTTKAAEEACLGAGAKLVGSFAYGLSELDVVKLEKLSPDLILLCGGTDGGNVDVIVNNAEMIAKSSIKSPIIIAGNRMATQTVQTCLRKSGKDCFPCENVLPELDRLEVEPAREFIRGVFTRRIVNAKGLDKIQDLIGSVVMPTPRAVMKGFELLARGTDGQVGLGELVGIDVGGATIDVHSISAGFPSQPGVVLKGIPEPYVKRTVEGDIGIRYSASHILEKAGKSKVKKVTSMFNCNLSDEFDMEALLSYLSTHIGYIPQNEREGLLDAALAYIGVEIAMRRHSGFITEMYSPMGKVFIQSGKDLTGVKTIIGTGGIFKYGKEPKRILGAALYSENDPSLLKPIQPESFYLDKDYILFAIGLAAEIDAEKALKIMMKSLLKL